MTAPLHHSPASAFLKVTGKRMRTTWCALIAFITALAFIALVSTSVSHIHQTSQETQDCSICSIVTDKVGSGFTATALPVTRFVVLFAIAALTLSSSLHATALLLPRSCGPPGSI